MNITTIAQLRCTICFMPLNLSGFLFPPFLPSHSLFSFHCTTLLTPTFICLWEKKRPALFFLACFVVTHFSPRPVSCVFSPISGILRSPPSMWVTLMCAAGLSCRAGSSPLCNLGALRVLVCLGHELCVCSCLLYTLCDFPWKIITTAGNAYPNDSWFLYLYVCVMFS